MSTAIDAYAHAIWTVAQAEGSVDQTRAQLTEVAQAVAANSELASALSDNLIPSATRISIVDEILTSKVTDTVRALMAMVVGAGRGSELSEIVHAFSEAAATASGKRLATVRTAVALSEDQKIRLAAALSAQAGGSVELENIVDPDIVGGAITTIGDTVIDGSIRSSLSQLKEAL